MSTIPKRKRDTEVVANIIVKQMKYQKPGTTTVLKKLVFHRTDAVQSHGTSVSMHKKKIPSSLVRKETSGLVCVLGMKLKKANSTILEKVKIIEDLKKLIKVPNLSFLEKVNTSEPSTVVNVEIPVTAELPTVVNAEIPVTTEQDIDTHNRLVKKLQRRDVTIKEKNETIKYLKTKVSSKDEEIKDLKTKILREAKETEYHKKQVVVVTEDANMKMEDLSAQVVDMAEDVDVLERKLKQGDATINFLEKKSKDQEENVSKMMTEQGNMKAQRQILKKVVGSGSTAKVSTKNSLVSSGSNMPVQNMDVASQSKAKKPPTTVGDLLDDELQQVRKYVINSFHKKTVIAKCPDLKLLAQKVSIGHDILLRYVYKQRSKIMAHLKRIFPVTPVQYVTCPMVRCFLAVTHLNRMGGGCDHPVKNILGTHDRCDAPNCPFCLLVHGQVTL